MQNCFHTNCSRRTQISLLHRRACGPRLAYQRENAGEACKIIYSPEVKVLKLVPQTDYQRFQASDTCSELRPALKQMTMIGGTTVLPDMVYVSDPVRVPISQYGMSFSPSSLQNTMRLCSTGDHSINRMSSLLSVDL